MLNFFDVIITTIIVYSIFRGANKGFIKMLLGNMAIIASIYVTILSFPYIQDFIYDSINSSIISFAIAVVFFFLACLIVFSILIAKITKVFNGVSGGLIDQLCGLILGAVNGAIISMILFIIIAGISSGQIYKPHKNAFAMLKSLDHSMYPYWFVSAQSFGFFNTTLDKCLSISAVELYLKKFNSI